ncbi:hypothetical protein Taro_050512, partial [Colocasia esculenta]|nr:hypothetical protein [Colocasia esculenta]
QNVPEETHAMAAPEMVATIDRAGNGRANSAFPGLTRTGPGSKHKAVTQVGMEPPKRCRFLPAV